MCPRRAVPSLPVELRSRGFCPLPSRLRPVHCRTPTPRPVSHCPVPSRPTPPRTVLSPYPPVDFSFSCGPCPGVMGVEVWVVGERSMLVVERGVVGVGVGVAVGLISRSSDVVASAALASQEIFTSSASLWLSKGSVWGGGVRTFLRTRSGGPSTGKTACHR